MHRLQPNVQYEDAAKASVSPFFRWMKLRHSWIAATIRTKPLEFVRSTHGCANITKGPSTNRSYGRSPPFLRERLGVGVAL